MLPTPDQIRAAAYDRWQRRGGGHGHDRDDWLRAEQDLLFALNYDVVTRVGPEPSSPRADGNGAARPGAPGGRVCRFCEQAAPRVRFPETSVPGPSFRADGHLIVPDECDECRRLFEESFEEDVARFLGLFRDGGTAGDPVPAVRATAPYVPIAAFKGLTRMALACLPRAELTSFEDAIEWVGNPEHDFDARAFGPLACVVHLYATALPTRRATLSLRRDDDAPMPYALFHLGDGRALFQIAVPHCGRDDDLDGQDLIVPRAAPPLVTGRDDDPITSVSIALASPRATRETRL